MGRCRPGPVVSLSLSISIYILIYYSYLQNRSVLHSRFDHNEKIEEWFARGKVIFGRIAHISIYEFIIGVKVISKEETSWGWGLGGGGGGVIYLSLAGFAL